MSPGYAAERFQPALIALASGTGPIQARVASAWLSGLWRLEAEALPDRDGIREEFTALREEVYRSDADEGKIQDATSGMTDEQASSHARRIADLYLYIAPYYFRKG